MDASQSDFGPLPAVSAITDRITQGDKELVIKRTRDGQDLTIRVPLDGSSKDNDILGMTMSTDGHWDGNALLVNFSGTRNGNAVSYKERWTLTADGKTFEVARHLTGRRGSTDQKLVMLKQ